VKLPEPVQLVPLMVHLPLIVLPCTVPFRLSVLPAGVPEFTVSPKLPVTLPLKFPLRVTEPVSVSPDTKQPELLVNWTFEIFNDPSPFTVSAVPKLRAVALLESFSVACHVPLILELELFAPHPIRTRPHATTTVATNCLMGVIPRCEIRRDVSKFDAAAGPPVGLSGGKELSH